MFFELFGLKLTRRNIFYKANRHTFITETKTEQNNICYFDIFNSVLFLFPLSAGHKFHKAWF